MRKEENNRGQLYLIATVIIVAVIIGFAAVSNYSRSEVSTRIYDLGDDLGIESAKVLDYGTYHFSDDPENMKKLLENFIEAYSEYGEIDKLYFIFGNAAKITVYGYRQLVDTEEITLKVEGASSSKDIRVDISQGSPVSEALSLDSEEEIQTVTVQIAEGEYKFDLEPGENFYFIIVITEDEEKYVFVGGE